MIAASRAKAPTTVKRTVPPGRLPNADYRSREYLTEREVERLMKVAVDNRHGHRDATMILLAFRHGLRASELCSLRWEQVDLTHGRLHVQRLKNGMPSVHPLTGTELRALRRLQREQAPGLICVRERARSADVGGWLSPDADAAWPSLQDAVRDPPPHAAAFNRVQARQPGRGYPVAATLPRPQEHPAHGTLY